MTSQITASPAAPRPHGALRPCAVWKRGTRVTRQADGLLISDDASSAALRPLPSVLSELLETMGDRPLDLDQVETDLGLQGREAVEAVLGRVDQRVAWQWRADGDEVLVCEHTARGPWSPPLSLTDTDVVRLHRFALLRTLLDELVLESPLGTTRVVLTSQLSRDLVARLGRPSPAHEVAAVGVDPGLAREILEHLLGEGLIERADPAGRFHSDADPVLRQWDYHDLLMHSRIRSGRFDQVQGAVYPFRGEIAPEPARRPVPDGPRLTLTRPDLDAVSATEPSLTAVIEARRSVRQYGSEPMTADQLGEFLYRVARTRATYSPASLDEEERVSRPYPSGGGAYELELFLTVRRCAGVPAGLYYYDPVDHELVLVNDSAKDAELMLNVASTATGLETRPDVLITLTSRFARLSWKYRGIAYASSLRHTGVVYQTMYLVATAMGLAPCGLGLGDADLAARAYGLDYLRESSVGDFLLGSRPAVDPAAGALTTGWTLVNHGRSGTRSFETTSSAQPSQE